MVAAQNARMAERASVEQVAQGLRSPSAVVRKVAVAHAAAHGEGAFALQLAQALGDVDGEVARAALVAFARVGRGAREAVPTLQALLPSEAALVGLGVVGEAASEAAASVAGLLDSARHRALAVETLVRIAPGTQGLPRWCAQVLEAGGAKGPLPRAVARHGPLAAEVAALLREQKALRPLAALEHAARSAAAPLDAALAHEAGPQAEHPEAPTASPADPAEAQGELPDWPTQSLRWVVRSLEARHLEELAREASAGLSQFGAPEPSAPALMTLAALERSYFFLRQAHHRFDRIRADVARLGFAWGAQFVHALRWSWASVSADGALQPAVVSPCGRYALHPAETVARLLADGRPSRLLALFNAATQGDFAQPDFVRCGDDGPPSPEAGGVWRKIFTSETP